MTENARVHLASLVEMVESGFDDRVLLAAGDQRVSGSELGRLVRVGASRLGTHSAVVYAGENHPLLPVVLLSAAWAGIPFVPVNYRLEDTQLNALIDRNEGALVLCDTQTFGRVTYDGRVQVVGEWLDALNPDTFVDSTPDAGELDDDDVAIILYTSGTTSEPKAALLRHRHMMAYLLGSVEFGSAQSDEAALISVPPYHVAGVANMLSNIFAGRRLVYMRSFDAATWLDTVRDEGVTNAMVVPTMLARIVDALDGRTADVPTLRSLSYGGAKVSERVLRDAIRLLPGVGFVNAYGLTETASTIAVLGPEAHRAAIESDDPVIRRRLLSAGQVLPMVEIELRDDDGRVVGPGESGVIHLRGEQISGEYSTASLLDHDGWFCTRDRGFLDDEGYLFIEGRVDDTIIRGGENIAPAEVEEVLLSHPAVAEACVVGAPDDTWGQCIVAVVVLRDGMSATNDELRGFVREVLRGSKTPETVLFRDHLPHTETGKLLRRVVQQEVADLS